MALSCVHRCRCRCRCSCSCSCTPFVTTMAFFLLTSLAMATAAAGSSRYGDGVSTNREERAGDMAMRVTASGDVRRLSTQTDVNSKEDALSFGHSVRLNEQNRVAVRGSLHRRHLTDSQGNATTTAPEGTVTDRTTAAGGTTTTAADGTTPRVVGGVTASASFVIYQVAILVDNGATLRCGGTIVDPLYIVTAAHCFVDDYGVGENAVDGNNILVRYGSIKWASGGGRIAAVRIWINQYNNKKNDVAVLKLASAIPFSSTAASIRLSAGDNGLSSTDADLSVSGWGKINPDAGNIVSSSRIATVNSLPNTCRVAFPSTFVSSVMVCAGCAAGGVDACFGDSGSPLVSSSASNGCPALVGIVSFGEGCAEPGRPGVYTRVSSYVNWIEAIIKKPMRSTRLLQPTTNCDRCGGTRRCGEAPPFSSSRCQTEAWLANAFSLTSTPCAAGSRTLEARLNGTGLPSNAGSGKVYFLGSTGGAGKAVVRINGVQVNTPLKSPVVISQAVAGLPGRVWRYVFRAPCASSARYAAVYVSSDSQPFYQASLAIKAP